MAENSELSGRDSGRQTDPDGQPQVDRPLDPTSPGSSEPPPAREAGTLRRGWGTLHAGIWLEALAGDAGQKLSADDFPTGASGPRYVASAEPPEYGGVGRVWRAVDHLFNRPVALKELRDEDPVRAKRRIPRFIREARVTAQLDHPGIVAVHELGETPDGWPFYAMKFVHGRSLLEASRSFHRSVKAGRFDMLEFRGLIDAVFRVSQTLDYAHSRGVIHRDLKPRNVVLGDYGEVYLVDWGLAGYVSNEKPDFEMGFDDPVAAADAADRVDAIASGETASADILGTYAYMPPEQAEGRNAIVDRRSDVFGLGAILYDVLTGRPPFAGAKDGEGYWSHWDRQIPRPREVWKGAPRALEAISLKALEGDPDARYQSAGELAEDLRRWLADQPVSARREGLLERTARWGRNHRPAVAALLALFISALAMQQLTIGRTDAALERAKTAEANSREMATRASASYQQSLQTLDVLYKVERLATNTFAHVPGMTEQRHKVVLDTTNSLESLCAKDPYNPTLIGMLGESYRSLAQLDMFKGDHAMAEANLERAVDVNRTRNDPHDSFLAYSLLDLARLRLDDDRPNEAEAPNREAIALAESIPVDPIHGRSGPYILAYSIHDRGRIKEARGDLSGAIKDYDKADAIWASLVPLGELREGMDPVFQMQQRIQHTAALRAAGRMDNALALVEDSEKVVAELLVQMPESLDLPMIQRSLLAEHVAILLARGGDEDLEQAEPLANRATQIAEAQSSASPEIPDYAFSLAEMHARRADVASAKGDLAEADEHWSAAVSCAQDLLRSAPTYRKTRPFLAAILTNRAEYALRRDGPSSNTEALRLAAEAETYWKALPDRQKAVLTPDRLPERLAAVRLAAAP